MSSQECLNKKVQYYYKEHLGLRRDQIFALKAHAPKDHIPTLKQIEELLNTLILWEFKPVRCIYASEKCDKDCSHYIPHQQIPLCKSETYCNLVNKHNVKCIVITDEKI